MICAFQSVLEQERIALADVAAKLSAAPDTIAIACEALAGCGPGSNRRLIVAGIGKAGLIGRKVAATLSSTGTAAMFLHPVDALHGDLGFVRPRDGALLFSYSGESVELIRLARELRQLNCSIVAITRSRTSTLGRLATASIEIGEVQEACHLGLAPTSSTTVMLAVGDALAIAVAKANDFGRQDFARNHPAGALGLSFRSVREAMRTGDRLVCLGPQTTVREAVSAVSRARTGAAVLVDPSGALVGIFTDGDLRRAILKSGNVLERDVRLFSSIPCHFIGEHDTVANALKLFHNTRTEDLPVVEPKTAKVTGLICLKDITVY